MGKDQLPEIANRILWPIRHPPHRKPWGDLDYVEPPSWPIALSGPGPAVLVGDSSQAWPCLLSLFGLCCF